MAETTKHGCCQYPWMRIEDEFGGRTAPSRGQCDCECHEKRIPRELVWKYSADCNADALSVLEDMIAFETEAEHGPSVIAHLDFYMARAKDWNRYLDRAKAIIAKARGKVVPS